MHKWVHARHTHVCFEYIELPAKLLDYFLQSNKSNINYYLEDTTIVAYSVRVIHPQPNTLTCTVKMTHPLPEAAITQ